MVKKIVIIVLILLIVYYVSRMLFRKNQAVLYLKDIGIPDDIINRMSSKEIEISASYLKEYADTRIHFANDHKHYKELVEIRRKYGIFL